MSEHFRAFKHIAKFIFALMYRLFLPLIHKNPRRIVVYYHGLNTEDIDNFEKQMAYLAKHSRSVKASEIITASPNGASLVIGITFDDALVSVSENAVPVLRKYGLTATIFVPMGNLGSRPKWAFEEGHPHRNETVISEEQIVRLDEYGYEILSHTVSHPNLTETDDVTLKAELIESKETLERILGHDVIGLSYPYGAYDTRVCNATKEAGYQICFSTETCTVNASSDNFQIGRFKVSPTDSMLTFKLKINGAYEVLTYLRRLRNMLLKR